MNKILLFIFLVITTLACRKETPEISESGIRFFGARGDDIAQSLIHTADGGYVIAGNTSNGKGARDAFLKKLDKHGNTLWHSNFGGIYEDEMLHVAETPDGGFIGVGYTNHYPEDSLHTFTNSSSNYIVKVNRAGQKEWEKITKAGTVGEDYATSVSVDADKNYVITGVTEANYFTTGVDGFILKMKPDGEIIFYRTLNLQYNEQINHALIDKENNLVFVGEHTDNAKIKRFLMGKARPDGTIIWTKVITQFKNVAGNFIKPGLLNNSYIIAVNGKNESYLFWADGDGPHSYKEITVDDFTSVNSIITTHDKKFIVCGMTATEGGFYQTYLQKIDDKGNVLWSKKYNGTYGSGAADVTATNGGGYAVVGQCYRKNSNFSNYYFFKTDADGNIK